MAIDMTKPFIRLPSPHTAGRCAVCDAFCAELTLMVAEGDTCDRLRERDLLDRCDYPRGVFTRHLGGMQRCVVTAYVQISDQLLTPFEEAFTTADTWETGLRDGILAGVAALDELPGASRFYFIAADRSGDPVIWLERGAVRDRFLHALCSAPHPTTMDDFGCELFSGALQVMLREHLVAHGDFADRDGLAQEIDALVAVFAPDAS